MHRLRKFVKIGAFVAGMVLVGALLGWWATRGWAPAPQLAPAPEPNPAESTSPGHTQRRPLLRPEGSGLTNPVQLVATDTNLVTDWENRLDAILASDKEESEKAQQMFELFPRLPEDGQVEVAQHLSNLVTDEEYAPLAQFLTNSALPEAVLDVLMSDVLNRANSLKLPLLLQIARDESHPKAGEAKDLLELYLEEDFGKDWDKWRAKMEQWLKDNPD